MNTIAPSAVKPAIKSEFDLDSDCEDLRVEDYSSDDEKSSNEFLNENFQKNVIHDKTKLHVQTELRRTHNRQEVFKLAGPHVTPIKRASRTKLNTN